MARSTRDSKLETRAARDRLAARPKPYWRAIHKGLALGYRKGKVGGSWCARRYLPDGRHTMAGLGLADDHRDADGETILSYYEAQERARAWADALDASYRDGRCYRVRDAVDDYLAWFALNRKSHALTVATCERHILPALGDLPVATLTAPQIRAWHQRLATHPARLRTAKGAETPNLRQDNDPRARQATANRILSVLKAALNYAWHNDQVESDLAWRKVKPFPRVDAPRISFLSPAQCVGLVDACPPDLRRLVQAALYTGARFGELARFKVSDLDRESRTLYVAKSKSGRERHITLTVEGLAFFERLARYRFGDLPLLVRADDAPWKTSQYSRPFAEACRQAKIDVKFSFHGLRHTYGAALARAGTPLQIIAAALGHRDTRITERHYAHLLPSHIADTIRANLPDLGAGPRPRMAAD
ncbi:MAG: tyrosine-type recombinase/integrase [Gammaproteobacteria bacterium]